MHLVSCMCNVFVCNYNHTNIVATCIQPITLGWRSLSKLHEDNSGWTNSSRSPDRNSLSCAMFIRQINARNTCPNRFDKCL